MSDLDSQLAAAIADRYRIERELGRGGMATVHLAHDLKHDRPVALKVLHPDLAASMGADRFLREIRMAARLQHPHILPIFDSGNDGGRLWYTMPYVAGETLRDRLRREGQLGVEESVRIGAEVADALDYAHTQGIVHRDIKPENVLLSGSPADGGRRPANGSHALVADFGIAHVVDVGSGERLTETGLALGTAGYMSPEQATGERSIDGRSDIYALGCLIYEMLVGEPPFTGPTTQVVIARCLTNPVPSIRTVRPAVSASLDDVVSRALAKVAADRWPSAGDLGAALRRAERDIGKVATRRASERRFALGRPALFGIGVAVAAGVIAAGSAIGRGVWSRSARSQPPAERSAAQADPQIVALYRQGQRQLRNRTQGSLLKAISAFTEATRRDSAFALGWVGLAQALGWARTWEFDVPGVPAESLLARRLDATERAIQLDSLNPAVWTLRANVAIAVDPTSRDVALAAVRRALALDSLSAEAWQLLGVIREDLGDRDGALSALRRAIAFSKGQGPVPFLSNHFYWSRQFDSALVWGDSAVALNPTFPYAREVLGQAALELGHLDRAEAAYEAARRLDTGPTAVRSLEGLAEVAVRRGDTTGARRHIAEAEALVDGRRISAHAAIAIASAYAAANDPARALPWLERYQPKGDLHFQLHLRRDPQLDPLRATRRFVALVGEAVKR